MKNRQKPDRPAGRSIPVRFPNHVIEEIDRAVEATGMSQQEIIRRAAEVGLKDLRRIKYDISGVIHEMAKKTFPNADGKKNAPTSLPAQMQKKKAE